MCNFNELVIHVSELLVFLEKPLFVSCLIVNRTLFLQVAHVRHMCASGLGLSRWFLTSWATP